VSFWSSVEGGRHDGGCTGVDSNDQRRGARWGSTDGRRNGVLAMTSDVELAGVAPECTGALVLPTAACGERPTRAATPKLGGAPVKEEGPIDSGTQSISKRKSKVDEGGAKISVKGKEASSKVT
jgi:hypothetical protein